MRSRNPVDQLRRPSLPEDDSFQYYVLSLYSKVDHILDGNTREYREPAQNPDWQFSRKSPQVVPSVGTTRHHDVNYHAPMWTYVAHRLGWTPLLINFRTASSRAYATLSPCSFHTFNERSYKRLCTSRATSGPSLSPMDLACQISMSEHILCLRLRLTTA